MVNVITNFNNFKVVHSNNKIGIGTTNPVSTLDVTGDIRCSNDLYAKDSLVVGYSGGTGDATFSGNIVTDSIVVNSTSSFTSATFSGYIDTQAIVVDGTSTFTGELVASTATLDTIKIKDRIALSTNVDFGSSGYALISGGTSENSWSSVITETAISTLETATSTLQIQANANSSAVTTLFSATSTLQTSINNNATDISFLETATGTLKGLIDTNISDISELISETDALRGNIEANMESITDLIDSTAVLNILIATNTADISTLENATGYLKGLIDSYIHDISIINGKIGILESGTSTLSTDISDLQIGTSTLSTDISDLQIGTSTLSTDIGNLQIGTSTLSTDIGNLQSGTSSLQTQIDDIATNDRAIAFQNIRSFNISQSAGDYSATDNTVYFSSFYAQTTTDYNRARVYTTINTASFSGRVGVCIFSDTNQAPNSRLAYGESSVQSNISGLQEIVITISDFSSTKNTKYWIGISTYTTSGTLYLQKFAYAYTSGEFLRKKASFYTAGGSPPFSTTVSATISSDVLYYFEIYNPNMTESTNELANYLNLNETNSQTITGPITLEDDISLSTNSKIQLGSSYGSSGQVLTSNGSGSAPTWQTVSTSAYYLYAFKNSNQTINNETYTDITGFTVNTYASTTEASGDFNTTTGQWTPPQGVYIFMCHSRVWPAGVYTTTTGDISRVVFVFADQENTELFTDDNMNEENDDGRDIIIKTVNISSIIYANGNTTYKMRIMVRRDYYTQIGVATVSGAEYEARHDTAISAYKIG